MSTMEPEVLEALKMLLKKPLAYLREGTGQYEGDYEIVHVLASGPRYGYVTMIDGETCKTVLYQNAAGVDMYDEQPTHEELLVPDPEAGFIRMYQVRDAAAKFMQVHGVTVVDLKELGKV